VRQWFYYSIEWYGGPKYDQHPLDVADRETSEDPLSIRGAGLKAGHVVYWRLDPRLSSQMGNELWTA
jgi:hypothetical protein